MEHENNIELVSVHTKEDVDYYSINAIDNCGDIEHYIVNKNCDLQEICEYFDLNMNKSIEMAESKLKRDEIYLAKDVEIKALTVVSEKVFAISTNQRKCPLIIKSKNDCIRVIVFDPNKKIAALAIIDINETLDKALKKLVLELNLRFNCNPMDLKISILSVCNSKKAVSDELLDIFKNSFHNINHCICTNETGETLIDMCKINIATLLEVGIKYENITLVKSSHFPNAINEEEDTYIIVNIK